MAKGVAVAGASLLSLALWGCNVTEPPPFDAQAILRADRVNSAAVQAAPLVPLPTTRQSWLASSQPSPTSRPMAATQPSVQQVRLPLREIMQRAAANSADVRVAGYDPAIAETKVVENEGHYDPIFFSNVRFDKQNDRTPGTVIPNPSDPSTTITINTENNNIYTVENGIKQYLETGGQVSLSMQFQQSDYSPVRYTSNNYWDSELKLQLTQPLLREFGYEVNWARITVARNDQRVSLLDFRKALEDNTEQIEKDYWQLYEAQREVEIDEQLLHETQDLNDLLFEQYIIGGKATLIEWAQSDAALNDRANTLDRARAKVGDISDDIKHRMGDPDFQIAGPLEILPADAPVETPIHFDLQDQIATAQANRLELGQQQIRENSAEVARQVAFNGLYPKLDLVANASLQGLSDSLPDAISDQFGTGHMIYSLGLQLEVPLGNREAWAIYRRAELQQIQAIWAYKQVEDKVAQEVTTAWREVDTSWHALLDGRRARMSSEVALTGINEQQASGVIELTPQWVQLKLDAQQRLAAAQQEEAQELANYNIALSALERAKGTILRYNNIMMEEDESPWNRPSSFGPSFR